MRTKPRRRPSLRPAIVVLSLAGLALGALGWRVTTLEQRERMRNALEAAAGRAQQAADLALERATHPPAASVQWIHVMEPPAAPDEDVLLRELEHRAHVLRDRAGALALADQILADPAQPAARRARAALRAGAWMGTQGFPSDPARRTRYLETAAELGREVVEDGMPVAVVAGYHLARQEAAASSGLFPHIARWSEALRGGDRVWLDAPVHVPVLIAGVVEVMPAEAPRPVRDALDDLYARAKRATVWAKRFRDAPEGALLVDHTHWAVRRGKGIEIRAHALLLTDMGLGRGESVEIVPRHVTAPDGPRLDDPRFVAVPGAEPLHELAFRARVRDPLGALAARVPWVAGWIVYALASVMAVAAMRRRMQAAQRESDFVAAVSHELKTPIASVRAMAELLGGGLADEPDKARDVARRIEGEMDRLGTTVRNALDVARVEEQGRLPLTLRDADPGEVVRRALETARPLLEAQAFDLEVDVQDATQPHSIDPEALRGVLANLLDNARKYSIRDVRCLGVRAKSDRVGTYRIEVSDRGVGIDRAEMERIFDRFYRSQVARERAVPGVGLGLYVARRIVEQHGGTLTASPRAGGGSVFTLELPTAPAPAPM